MTSTDAMTYQPAPEPGAEALGRGTGFWGMLLLVFTEAGLFASMFLAYFYERANTPDWPPTGIDKPELVLPMIMTVLLVSSSITMYIAERGIARDSHGTLLVALVLSVLLSGSFLGLQAYEYTHTSFSLDNSVYSSLFFTITGIHGIHVSIAVLMGIFITVRAFLGHFTPRHYEALTNVSIYWHFVDVVWLFILVFIYISPHVL